VDCCFSGKFLAKKKKLAGGFCCGKTISGHNKKFPDGRSLLLLDEMMISVLY
jgi:hypothetical protein